MTVPHYIVTSLQTPDDPLDFELKVPAQLPASTEGVDADGGIRQVGGKIAQVPAVMTRVRDALPSLIEGLRGLQAASRREREMEGKVGAYDRLTLELQTLANKVVDGTKRFDAQKERIREYLERLRGLAAPGDQGKFSDLLRRLDGVAAPTDAGQMAVARQLTGASDKLVADARAAVRVAFGLVGSEGAECSAFLGPDPAGQVRRQLAETRDELVRDLDRIVQALSRRLTKIDELVKISTTIINKEGPEKVRAARAKGDVAEQQRLERLVEGARRLLEAARKEGAFLLNTGKEVAKLKRTADDIRKFDFGK